MNERATALDPVIPSSR